MKLIPALINIIFVFEWLIDERKRLACDNVQGHVNQDDWWGAKTYMYSRDSGWTRNPDVPEP